MKIAIGVMGAGLSRRFITKNNKSKLLYEFNGIKICEYLFSALQKVLVNFKDIPIVVTYYDKEMKEIIDKYEFIGVVNDKYYLGQSESIKLIVSSYKDYDLIVFIPADQCFLKSKSLTEFLQFCSSQKDVSNKIISAIDSCGIEKSPVAFGKSFFYDLLKLEGDIGGKKVLRANKDRVETFLFSNQELVDIDTIEDIKLYFD